TRQGGRGVGVPVSQHKKNKRQNQASKLGAGWRNPYSAQYHVGDPLACIIILSVRAAQHAAETNRRSADHLAREHPRSRRNFPAASQTRRLEANRTAQRNSADLPGNS